MKAAHIALFLAAVGAFAFCLLNPSADVAHPRVPQRGARRHSHASSVGPHELDFPYYSLRDGSNSTLLLINRSPDSVPFQVALRSLSGKTLLAPSQTIPAHEKLSIDVAALVAEIGGNALGDFAEGSAAIYFVGKVRPLTGHINISDPLHRGTWQGERVPNAPQRRSASKELDAVWWGIGGGRDAMVKVSNTTAAAVTADVFLDFLGARHASATLTFAAYETKPLSITGLLAGVNISPSQAPSRR